MFLSPSWLKSRDERSRRSVNDRLANFSVAMSYWRLACCHGINLLKLAGKGGGESPTRQPFTRNRRTPPPILSKSRHSFLHKFHHTTRMLVERVLRPTTRRLAAGFAPWRVCVPPNPAQVSTPHT